MSENDAINERLNGADERLNRGEAKFAEVTDALSRITDHLQSQDETMAELGAKIDAQGKSTAAIVDMWDGGVNATRFFCRLARGWEWMVKQIFSKRFVALVIGYVVVHYLLFHSLPDWTKWAVTLFKIYQGA